MEKNGCQIWIQWVEFSMILLCDWNRSEKLYISTTHILLPTHKSVWEESGKKLMYTKNIYKVAAIMVGHIRFLPI